MTYQTRNKDITVGVLRDDVWRVGVEWTRRIPTTTNGSIHLIETGDVGSFAVIGPGTLTSRRRYSRLMIGSVNRKGPIQNHKKKVETYVIE